MPACLTRERGLVPLAFQSLLLRDNEPPLFLRCAPLSFRYHSHQPHKRGCVRLPLVFQSLVHALPRNLKYFLNCLWRRLRRKHPSR